MKNSFARVAALAFWLTGMAFSAHARPPTVTISPGYDARLSESSKRIQPPPSAAKRKTILKSSVSAADKAWIDTCVTQRKASNAKPAALRKYCGCMHEVVEDNQPFDITELERTYPPIHEGCWTKYRMR